MVKDNSTRLHATRAAQISHPARYAWHGDLRSTCDLTLTAAPACLSNRLRRHRELAAAGKPLELSRASLCDLLNARAAVALM